MSDTTLGSLFLSQCETYPEKLAYGMLVDDAQLGPSCSFGELRREVEQLAAWLVTVSAPGDRVVLAFPAGLDFVRIFWACILTGRIAVPVPPPDRMRLHQAAPRLRSIIADARAAVVLTTGALLDAAASALDPGTFTLARWRALPVEAERPGLAPRAIDVAPAPTSIAYLQYTSGSTSAPRGVRLSHANVIANARAMIFLGRGGSEARALSWLPHFHDYGLVIGIISPIVAGASSYLMSPIAFLRRPMRWLEAIGTYRITHTGAPDSGFAACLQAIEGKPITARLDSLLSLSCGAEPVRADTMERALAVFGAAGMPAAALMPSYGLAEAVLGVTIPQGGAVLRVVTVDAAQLRDGRFVERAAEGATGRRFVACGQPLEQTEVCIVDGATRTPCAPGTIGEIWVRSPSVGSGYWMQAEASEDTFDAWLADGRGPWLRTGDLGVRDDGDLFVTGRAKDLVIVHGENHYPQDLEWTAERAHGDLRIGHSAAFAVDSPAGEALVLVVEVELRVREPDIEPVYLAVRHAIAMEHGLPLHALALVRTGSLPRTSSGKIRRRDCRAAFLDQTLALVAPVRTGGAALLEQELSAILGEERAPVVAPRDDVERAIHDIWVEVLGAQDFGVHESFFALGGSSLRMTQVVSRVNARFDIDLPLGELLDHASIAALASEVRRHRSGVAGGATPRLQAPVAIARDRALPTSLSQRRMWLIQHFDPASTAYNVPVAMRLRGHFDLALCQQALDLMVQRHEGLRTRFLMGEREPMQWIEPALTVPIEYIDLLPLPASERQREARALLALRVAQPFDLAVAPLHRPTVVRLGEREHVLFWLLHHGITDNWAGVLLMREALEAYGALVQGRVPKAAPLAIQYADYASWQRLPESVEARRPHMAYWLDQLRDLPDLALPTDFPRPARASFKGARVFVDMSPRLRAGLREFGGREAATPFVVLLSAFALFMSRMAASEDVPIGIPIANRHRLVAEQLVGTLVNTLVLRADLSGDPSFLQLVHRMRRRALDAYAHQDAPYDELIDALGHDRTLRPEGPVRVLFNVLNAPVGEIDYFGLDVDEFDFERSAAQFDLSMHVDTEFSHRIHLEYASDLYSHATASRMLENYLSLVERLLEQPALSLGRVDTVSPAHMNLLRHGWNGAKAPLPAQQLVHRYVGTDDPRVANRVAVVDAEGRELSFDALEAASNRIAHTLRGHGVGRGARVGLCIARGPAMLIAQLGVMKAGAAYVPLDPAYPVDRLRFMAVDADLAMVLTQAGAHDIVEGLGIALHAIDDPAFLQSAPESPLAPDPARDATPADDAYVIYTSGSTGQPKGVKVPHRGVVNFLEGFATMPGMGAEDCVVAITSPSFDPSVLDLLLPLRVRARLVIASHAQTQDPFALRALLEQSGATLLQATPSAWRLLIDAGWHGTPIFRALIGGEALPPILAERLMARTGELWNIYGPTETTVWTTGWKVDKPRERIAIGRPIPNTTVWVLDAGGRVCPIGVPGELHIGGVDVTAGYHRRDELTAAAFVPDPFADTVGARLYRTGDLGRWRHDGLLEHLGRADHQVKLRGHRIEMGEIESVLLDHPEVAHCVCVTRAESEDDVRLVAYFVPVPGRLPLVSQLRQHLRSVLPEYMVPQHFVLLDTMPQLPNGKVNRAALPAPAAESAPGDARSHLPPETHEERAIASIWSRVLGVGQIGLGDNFFDLGGHSLLAMQALTAIRAELGIELEPRQFIFETLRQMAHRETPEVNPD
ncbi:MAG: amino acid adenylation domain-containing protein [Variovorax sp.]|nr:MAG: amino acid adenylation domain-containing protein [Variovorax sp.]